MKTIRFLLLLIALSIGWSLSEVSGQNRFFIHNFTMSKDEARTVPVLLECDTGMWMFQFDIVMPDGLSVEGVTLAGSFVEEFGTHGFQLETGKLSNGSTRVLCSNLRRTKAIAPSTDLHVLDLTVKADRDLTATSLVFSLEKFLFIDNSSVDGENCHGSDSTCQVRIYRRGDVNLDGNVDLYDVNIVINIVLGKDDANRYDRRAYITSDNVIDVSDVSELINLILR